jgi:hypothetical protein
MRRILTIIGIAVVLLGVVPVTSVFASPQVAYTITITDLGQGCWGGGTLNVGGSMSGKASCAFDNGQVVYTIQLDSWSSPAPGYITFDYTIVPIKGYRGPTSFSADPLPVTGVPVIGIGPGATVPTLVRITPAG